MRDIDYENILDTHDEPSSKDWLYSDFIKNIEESGEWLNSETYRDKTKMKVRDQFDQKTTWKACSVYWLTSPYNWYNVREWASRWLEYKQENPRRKWEAYQATRLRPNIWSSLQAILKFFRERKLIDWHVKAIWVEEMKNALDNWFYIYTWSKHCSWKNAWKKWEFVYTTKWWAHCFSIIDYDGKWFTAINSFGDDRWNKWYFNIPFEDIKYLYSANVIIDHDDTGSLQKMKDEADIQKAISMWITNWSNLDDTATRREVILMMIRWLKK